MARRIFIAEDNADLAFLLEKRLSAHEGWTIVRAATKDEAQKRLQGDRFDAIVLDYLLPDGTGLDLLSIVRAASPQTPVLFLTAHGSENVALQALGLGATDYMQKDGHLLDDLPGRIDDLLKRERDVATSARVVPVEDVSHAAHPERRVRRALDPEVAAKALAEIAHGQVLGAAAFDGSGKPIAALLPEGTDATRLGAAVFSLHAQVGVAGRLASLVPRAYAFTMEHADGVLAVTSVTGRCLVAVLVAHDAGEARAREALAALVKRVQ